MSGSLLCAGERNWIKVVKQMLINCINVILLSCKNHRDSRHSVQNTGYASVKNI